MYRLSRVVLGNANKSFSQNFNIGLDRTKRKLFTLSSLQIDSFLETRKNEMKLINNADEFKAVLRENLKKNENYLIYADVLKKVIRISNTDEDLHFLRKLLLRYNEQTKSISFQKFRFGPEVLRLYFILNKPVEAYNLVMEGELQEIFCNFKCYFILMDLLYKSQMYNDVLNCFEYFNSNQIESKKYNYLLSILYSAACYKLNTKEALLKGANLIKEMSHNEVHFIPFRSVWFLSMLAHNQNESLLGLELLNLVKKSSVTVNIEARILAQEGRHNDAIYVLKSFLFDKSLKFFLFVTEDTMEFLEAKIVDAEPDIKSRFVTLKEEINAHNYLSKKTLDSHICEEIVVKKYIEKASTQQSYYF